MSRMTRRTVLPVNQITPLTYRDGVTYIQMLTQLSEYVKGVLHPSLQHTVDQVVADVETQMDKHHDQYVDGVQEFQRIHDAFMSDVNAHLIALNDGALTDLVDDDGSLFGERLRDIILEGVNTRVFDGDQQFNIPEDFPDLQAACDWIGARSIPPQTQIVVNISSGHRLTRGVSVENSDFHNVRITSDDDVVYTDIAFTGPLVDGHNSTLPSLYCVVDMHGTGGDGYSARNGSTGYVHDGCGVRNAGGRGLYVAHNSRVDAFRSEFTGAHNRNVWVTRTSILSAEESNFSANQGGDNAVYVSRGSTADLLDCDVSNAFRNGIVLARSTATVQGCDVSNAPGTGLTVGASSRASGKYMIGLNCGVHGANVSAASFADLGFSDFSEAAMSGIRASDASNVDARDIIANNCGHYGVHGRAAATINATNSTIRNNGRQDACVENGSFIVVLRATTTTGTPSANDTLPAVFNEFSGNGSIVTG